MPRFAHALLLLSLSLLLTNCNLMGYRRLAEENVSQIKKGVTTQAQVEDLLGQPMLKSRNADGTVTMTYCNQLESMVPLTGPSMRMLVVTIGQSGRVSGYSYTDQTGKFLRMESNHKQVGDPAYPKL